MSNKKKRKNRKPMDPRTKESLILGFRSLISNDACVELGRNRKWYGAIVAGVLSSILVVIPTLVGGMKVNGSDVLKTPTYGLEHALVHFQEDVKASGLDLKFDVADKLLSVNLDTWNQFVKSPNGGGSDSEPWYHHYNDNTGFLDFQVFFTTAQDAEFTSFATAVYNGQSPTGGVVTYANSSAATTAGIPTRTSALVLGTKEFRLYKVSATSQVAFGTPAINWQYEGNFPLNSLISDAPALTETDPTKIADYTKATINSWSPFLDTAYATQRNINAWRSTGIMWGVYSFFISFMGLMVWLMSRGKTNPFRVIQFWEAEKIAYWASPTPAVLAMIFGFFMNGGIMQFLFIFLLGMRIMWMSMRSLRPQQ